jgi:hypothetical protein
MSWFDTAKGMGGKPICFFTKEEYLPSLLAAIQSAGLDPGKVNVGFPVEKDRLLPIQDRHQVLLNDDKHVGRWTAPNLTELFRGNRPAPVLGDHPGDEHTPVFSFIELPLLKLGKVLGDPTDRQMEEIYATLRRRPDGRSLGFLHDALWQVCALLLAMRPLSQAEFEAYVNRLERSTRHMQIGPVSRNYLGVLRQTLGPARHLSIQSGR